MKKLLPQGLRRNLILTYLLLTISVGAIFSMVSIWSFNTLEYRLQRIDMGMAVDRLRNEVLSGNDPQRLDRFFYGAPGSHHFPEWLRNITPGFHKISHDGRILHVFIEDYQDNRYILLRDYTIFETSQRSPKWFFVIGITGSVILTLVIALFMTRWIISPIFQLSADVHARPAQPPGTVLAHHYPDNEIGQLAQAFDHAYNALEKALQREKLFTSDVSHELRTPLMVILSTCELLRESGTMHTDQDKDVLRIMQAAQTMQDELETYLLLARHAQKMPRHIRQLSLHDFISEHQAGWIAQASQHGNTLIVTSDQHATQETSRYPVPLLLSVTGNLLRNIAEHAGTGLHIQLTATEHVLEIRDNGKGIDASLQADIFSPFVSSEKDHPHHLGLGLSIVWRICTLANWRITLDTSAGKGCCFRIAFPKHTDHDVS